jgi:hypothetical protein
MCLGLSDLGLACNLDVSLEILWFYFCNHRIDRLAHLSYLRLSPQLRFC